MLVEYQSARYHRNDPAAVEEGGTAITPLADVFSGQRMGIVRCPFGVRWSIARHDRDVPTDEVQASTRKLLASPEARPATQLQAG